MAALLQEILAALRYSQTLQFDKLSYQTYTFMLAGDIP